MTVLGWWGEMVATERAALPPSVRLLIVRCGRYRLAFPSDEVRGLVSAGEVVPVEVGSFEGVLWREGGLIPATSLAPVLGLGGVKGIGGGHGVLARTDVGLVCLLVDEALDLVEVAREQIRDLPPLVVRVMRLEGLTSVADVEGLVLVAVPALLLGAKRAAELIAAAERVATGASTAPPGWLQ